MTQVDITTQLEAAQVEPASFDAPELDALPHDAPELDASTDLASTRPDEIARPGVGRYLWYAVGGSLAARHSTWVLHDVTCRTWWLRHFARTTLVVAPLLAAYLLLAPASWPIRIFTGLTFAAGIYLFSFVNILVDTDRRAVRAGYGFGVPSEIRSARAVQRHRTATYARRERIAERRYRRR